MADYERLQALRRTERTAHIDTWLAERDVFIRQVEADQQETGKTETKIAPRTDPGQLVRLRATA